MQYRENEEIYTDGARAIKFGLTGRAVDLLKSPKLS